MLVHFKTSLWILSFLMCFPVKSMGTHHVDAVLCMLTHVTMQVNVHQSGPACVGACYNAH